MKKSSPKNNKQNQSVKKLKNTKFSKSQKMKQAKYDDMRQIDWSYYGPAYWD